MAEKRMVHVKSTTALSRFDPEARKELVLRGLIALTEVRDADFYFFKGEEHRIKGELRQAIDNYEKALRIDPKHEDSLFWMGYCYSPQVEERPGDDLELGEPVRYKRSAEAFQKLKDIREKKGNLLWYDYVMYYNLGLAQEGLVLYEEAIENFEHALDLNSKHLNSYYMLGLCQEEIGLEHLAIKNFEKYLSLDGDKTPECIEYAESIVNKNIK